MAKDIVYEGSYYSQMNAFDKESWRVLGRLDLVVRHGRRDAAMEE